MRWFVDCTRKCNEDVVIMTTRDAGKSLWYPVVYLATCRGDAFIHDVSRMRLGSFVMDVPDGLILSDEARYRTVGESPTKPEPYGFGAATASAIFVTNPFQVDTGKKADNMVTENGGILQACVSSGYLSSESFVASYSQPTSN